MTLTAEVSVKIEWVEVSVTIHAREDRVIETRGKVWPDGRVTCVVYDKTGSPVALEIDPPNPHPEDPMRFRRIDRNAWVSHRLFAAMLDRTSLKKTPGLLD